MTVPSRIATTRIAATVQVDVGGLAKKRLDAIHVQAGDTARTLFEIALEDGGIIKAGTEGKVQYSSPGSPSVGVRLRVHRKSIPEEGDARKSTSRSLMELVDVPAGKVEILLGANDPRVPTPRVAARAKWVMGDNRLWYHGDSRKTLDFADQRYQNEAKWNAHGPGIYFTSSREQANGYAWPNGWVYTATIKGKLATDDQRPTRLEIRKFIGSMTPDERETLFSNWDENPGRALLKILDAYTQMDFVSAMADLARIGGMDFGTTGVEYVTALRKLGYVGALHKLPSVDHLVVWDPSALDVKSVEPYVSAEASDDDAAKTDDAVETDDMSILRQASAEELKTLAVVINRVVRGHRKKAITADRWSQFIANRTTRELMNLVRSIQAELAHRLEIAGATQNSKERRNTTLGDVATVGDRVANPHFWIQRNGSEASVGRPMKETRPDWFGVRVDTTKADPKQVFAELYKLWQSGYFKELAHGTLNLVHIQLRYVLSAPISVAAPPLRQARVSFKMKDRIPGGLADSKSREDFDPKSLAKGKRVEKEHVGDDEELAEEIASDHLVEDPGYYDKLEQIEKRAARPERLDFLKPKYPNLDWSAVEEADPTSEGSYLQWLAQQVSKGATLLPQTKELLSKFDLAKKQKLLPKEKADINKLSLADDLEQVVQEAEKAREQKELDDLIKARVSLLERNIRRQREQAQLREQTQLQKNDVDSSKSLSATELTHGRFKFKRLKTQKEIADVSPGNWCVGWTHKPSHYQSYSSEPEATFYFVTDDGTDPSGPWLLFLSSGPHNGELKDRHDAAVTNEELVQAVGELFGVTPHSAVGEDLAEQIRETTDVRLVLEHLRSNNPFVLSAIARHKLTPPKALAALANHDDLDVRCRVAENTSTPPATLAELSKNGTNWRIRWRVAGNTSTPPTTLVELSKDDDWTIREAVAGNTSTPPATLAELSKDDALDVRQAAAGNLANRKSQQKLASRVSFKMKDRVLDGPWARTLIARMSKVANRAFKKFVEQTDADPQIGDELKAIDPDGKKGYLNWAIKFARDRVMTDGTVFPFADGEEISSGKERGRYIKFPQGDDLKALREEESRAAPDWTDESNTQPKSKILRTLVRGPDGSRLFLENPVRVALTDDMKVAAASEFERAARTLKQYDVYRSKDDFEELTPLAQIHSISDLSAAVSAAQKAWNAKPRQERAKYEVLLDAHDEDSGQTRKVTRFDTKDAACLLAGGSTSWCFAKWHQTFWESYKNQDQDLYEVDIDDERYAVAINPDGAIVEVKTARNEDVDHDTIETIADVLETAGVNITSMSAEWGGIEDAEAWMQFQFDADEAQEWINHGVEDPYAARDWRDAGYLPQTAALLADAGLTPQEADKASEMLGGVRPLLRLIRNVNNFSAETLETLLRFSDGREWLERMFSAIGGDEEAINALREVKVDKFGRAFETSAGADALLAWADAGNFDISVEDVLRAVITAQERLQGRAHSPERAHRPDEATELVSGLIRSNDLDSLFDWISAVQVHGLDARWTRHADLLTPTQALAWTRAKIDPTSEYVKDFKWVKSPEEAAKWESAGIPAATVQKWVVHNFSPEEAKKWIAAGWHDPYEASRQRRHKFTLEQPKWWGGRDVDEYASRQGIEASAGPDSYKALQQQLEILQKEFPQERVVEYGRAVRYLGFDAALELARAWGFLDAKIATDRVPLRDIRPNADEIARRAIAISQTHEGFPKDFTSCLHQAILEVTGQTGTPVAGTGNEMNDENEPSPRQAARKDRRKAMTEVVRVARYA